MDEAILEDIRNSIVNGNIGVIKWSDGMLATVLKQYFIGLRENAKEYEAPAISQISDEYTILYSELKPPFELHNFIEEIIRCTARSKSAFVIMMVFLERV